MVLEEFAGNVLVGPSAAPRHIDLGGIGFGVGNELGN
jgi:hypothetical protein